jgi:methyl-accepting chemotaxis protein
MNALAVNVETVLDTYSLKDRQPEFLEQAMKKASRIGLSLGVRGKILTLFGITMFFMLAVAADGLWQFYVSLQAFDRDVMASQNNAIGVISVEAEFKKQVQEWKDTLLRGKKPDALAKYWASFQDREREVQHQAEQLSHGIPDPDTARLVVQFVSAHKSMGEAYRRGLEQFKAHDFDSAAGDGAVAGMDRPPTELLIKAKERLVSLAAARATEVKQAGYQSLWMTSVLLIVVTVITAAAFLVFVSRTISRPLLQFVLALRQLSEGNFDMTLPGLDRRDEIGDMAQAAVVFKENGIAKIRMEQERKEAEKRIVEQRKADMIKLADNFEAAVGEIVETVSSASTELEASATTLTSTAERAQELTTRVAAASEEASTNVQSVASATEEMASSVNEISRQVQESARMAGEAVDQARKTNDRVGELSKAAARIGDVVELINTIAGQTNLLALNATIEAARAGEAGRGFAVVASEVKALAEQTAKATGEIGQQISGIQAATHESVGAIKEISGTIEKLSEISATIASAVEEQGAATQEISRNVQQAAQGTQQVSSNITDVQRGASETGLASSQVLSAAQSLSGDSNRLKLEVGKFLGSVRAA